MKHNRSSSVQKSDSKSSNANRPTVFEVDQNEANAAAGDTEAAPADESSVTKFTNQLLKLAPGIADSAIAEAKKTVEHALATFEKGKETYSEARETLVQAMSTIEEVKASAKGAMGKIRQNPEPFFAAIAPGAIGIYLIVEKWRKSQMA